MLIGKPIKKWLEDYMNRRKVDLKVSVKDWVYMNRLQIRIERELDILLWLAVHKPYILKYQNENERLKKLLLIIKASMRGSASCMVTSEFDIELVLKTLKEDD